MRRKKTNKEKALEYLEDIRGMYADEMTELDNYIYWISCCKDIEDETVDLLMKAMIQRTEDICPTPEQNRVNLFDVCRKEWDKLTESDND